jgi:hypothetical protein
VAGNEWTKIVTSRAGRVAKRTKKTRQILAQRRCNFIWPPTAAVA